MVDPSQLAKHLQNSAQAYALQLSSIELMSSHEVMDPQIQVDPQIQELLNEFHDRFSEPRGLPHQCGDRIIAFPLLTGPHPSA